MNWIREHFFHQSPTDFQYSERPVRILKKRKKGFAMTNFDSRKDIRLCFQTHACSQNESLPSAISAEQGTVTCDQEKYDPEKYDPEKCDPEKRRSAKREPEKSGAGKLSASASSTYRDVNVSTLANSTNQARIEAFSNAVKEIFGDVLDARFYGNVTFHFTVQGGIIQTIRSGVERSIR